MPKHLKLPVTKSQREKDGITQRAEGVAVGNGRVQALAWAAMKGLATNKTCREKGHMKAKRERNKETNKQTNRQTNMPYR